MYRRIITTLFKKQRFKLFLQIYSNFQQFLAGKSFGTKIPISLKNCKKEKKKKIVTTIKSLFYSFIFDGLKIQSRFEMNSSQVCVVRNCWSDLSECNHKSGSKFCRGQRRPWPRMPKTVIKEVISHNELDSNSNSIMIVWFHLGSMCRWWNLNIIHVFFRETKRMILQCYNDI